MKKLILVSGPSGAGKGSVMEKITADAELNLYWCKTVTTRPQKSEDKGISRRIFVDRPAFKKMQDRGELLETNYFSSNWYGTPVSELQKAWQENKTPILEIDINGVKNLKKQYSKALTIFITASLEDLKERLIKRGRDTAEEIKKRIEIAKGELPQTKYFDITIENKEGKLKETIKETRQKIVEYKNE